MKSAIHFNNLLFCNYMRYCSAQVLSGVFWELMVKNGSVLMIKYAFRSS